MFVIFPLPEIEPGSRGFPQPGPVVHMLNHGGLSLDVCRKRKSVNIFRGTASLKRLSVLTDRQIQGDTQQRFFLKLRRVMYTTRTITC